MVKYRIPKTDYSKIAQYYDKVRPMSTDIWLSKIIEYGGIGACSTVLDVGCGTGRFPLSMWTDKSCRICALELSIEMLKQALEKDKSRDILWVGGDGQDLPFKDRSFDCIYMTLVIHHMEDKEKALGEIYRALKKGGKCVIMTNSHSRIKRHIIRDFPKIAAMDLKRFPSIPLLKTIMKKIGFQNVCYHVVRHDEGYIPTGEYLERVRNKYISTLTLLSDKAFQTGLKVFQERLRRKYGVRIRSTSEFVFVVGEK